MQIPVYVFTGFIKSGKTKFIQETFEDERFNDGTRTLLLVCEKGREQYDSSTYPHACVYLEQIEQEKVTTEELDALQKKHHAKRVVVELNGMQLVGDFYQKMPQEWVIAQEVMFADSTTIQAFNANLRNLVVDKLSGCEMVVFNRVKKGADTMPLHKLARAVNRRVDIVYDFTDGSTAFDEIEDPLPFDINAPVITIADEDYALFYRDITEEPKKYAGKTVQFKAQVAKLRQQRDGYFAPGRFVMTCCVEDIQFMGIPCKYDGSAALKARTWGKVKAKVGVKFHTIYKGTGPILTALEITPPNQPQKKWRPSKHFLSSRKNKNTRCSRSVPAVCRTCSLSKRSSLSWAFSNRYGRMGKGEEACWNAGKWSESWQRLRS